MLAYSQGGGTYTGLEAVSNNVNVLAEPRITAVTAGTTVEFPNLDGIFHNVFSVSPVKRFDLGKYPLDGPLPELPPSNAAKARQALVAAAHAAGVAVTVANPRQVRDFARGLGRRAKTDPIDARLKAG